MIAAPGHDPHSVVLWDAADRVLISADVLWQHGFGAIFPEIEGESGFAEQGAMLDLIAGLDPAACHTRTWLAVRRCALRRCCAHASDSRRSPPILPATRGRWRRC